MADDVKTKNYATEDDWLAGNPLYVWRSKFDGVKPMQDVADEAGVTRTTIMNYERGSFFPKHQYMIVFAKLMGLKTDTLYTKWQAWYDARPADTQPVTQVA
jgi:DNA-binding XRE family transcriptional regulator